MEKKQNKALAVVVLCATILVGAVLWGALYSLGLFASLIAFATAYVAIVLYDKFCNLTNKVYIISGIAIIVANLVASFVAIGISVAVNLGVDLGSAFKAVFEVIGNFVPELVKDAISCVILTVLGLITVKKTYEQRKKKQSENANQEVLPTDKENAVIEEQTPQTESSADTASDEGPKAE